jgi:hypothetical protein
LFLILAQMSFPDSGLGVGAILPFQKIKSLAEVLPQIQRRLALVSVLSYAAFMLISG